MQVDKYHIGNVREEPVRLVQLLVVEFFSPRGHHTDAVMDQFSAHELDVVRRYLAATGAAMAAHRKSLAPQATSVQ